MDVDDVEVNRARHIIHENHKLALQDEIVCRFGTIQYKNSDIFAVKHSVI